MTKEEIEKIDEKINTEIQSSNQTNARPVTPAGIGNELHFENITQNFDNFTEDQKEMFGQSELSKLYQNDSSDWFEEIMYKNDEDQLPHSVDQNQLESTLDEQITSIDHTIPFSDAYLDITKKIQSSDDPEVLFDDIKMINDKPKDSKTNFSSSKLKKKLKN